MIITYIRSSSYSSYQFCPFKYFLNYNLGISEPANKKAIIGNIVHKALEIMALQQLNVQNNKSEFLEEESGKIVNINDGPLTCLDIGWKYYTSTEKHIDWCSDDLVRCKELLNKALAFENGFYNPRKNKIVSPEQRFDIVLDDKPWAYYDYNGVKGHLAIRGTIDLVVDIDGDYHIYDWKTGKKYDWAKDKDKDFNSLNDDFQLMLYYYVVRKLYPEKNIYITIFYIDFADTTILAFDDETMKKVEQKIEKHFKEIKNTFYPKRNRTWKCTKLCHYGKNTLENKPVKDYTGSMCESIYNEVQQIGLSKVFEKRAKDKEFKKYSGGGRNDDSSRNNIANGGN